MTLPMTSAAEMIDEAYNLLHQDGQENIERGKGIASCAIAAATLEAVRLTLDAQASNLLSALEEPEPDGIDCCPECGCAPSVLGPDGVWVCEEYPGCSALMESSK